ncbi:CSLREA domain-containing protein [Pseudomonas mangrovi]|uniref:CSLREA domain-containing protein n=1 Tax=Pseudomonas mangrovi TaxID=2161748 RepID=A0A2T5PA27_9PSED|nr:CSLREA domain-containing protein [Pseudomonas mangrovi]PTU74579.1 hypothetical protein DBO85_10880 [Pseudomonas mangrovi]
MNRSTVARLTALLASATLCGSLAAAPLQVTTTADEYDGTCDSHCSLRDAVAAANQASGITHVFLPGGVYRLTRPSLPDANGFPGDEDDNLDGDLDVHGELVLQGQGEQNTRIIAEAGSRLLEVHPGARLVAVRMTLEGGRTAGTGGALENHGEALVREVLFSDNQAITPHSISSPPPVAEAFAWGQGGAIANYGTLQVHSSLFNRNIADALYWNDNIARGGAIFNRGDLVVRDSEFTRNSANDQGDRGYGGALYNQGTADVARSLFDRNNVNEMGSGAALLNSGGSLKLSNSSLSNSLYNGPLEITDAEPATATLIHVTATGSVANRGAMTVRNSLFVGSVDPYDIDVPTDCSTGGAGSSFTARGLLTSTPGGSCQADLYEDSERVFTHLLYPLADNGGRSRTYALRPGSLALDAGVGSCSGHDQRRVARPRDGDEDGMARCDLGAFER